MRTFEEDYKDLTVEGVLLFSFITSQTFHADVGSPPTTSERFSHFIIDIYDYFRYTKNSAKFEEFDAWNEKNIAAWQKIIDGPDGPPQK